MHHNIFLRMDTKAINCLNSFSGRSLSQKIGKKKRRKELNKTLIILNIFNKISGGIHGPMDALSSCSSHPLSPLQYSSWHTTQGHRFPPSLSKLGFLTVQAKQAPEALSLSCCLPSLISPCYYTPLLHQRKQAFLPLAISSSQPTISNHWHFAVFSLPLCRSSLW